MVVNIQGPLVKMMHLASRGECLCGVVFGHPVRSARYNLDREYGSAWLQMAAWLQMQVGNGAAGLFG